MKISQFINHLESASDLTFHLPNNEKVPAYFHITECGLGTKHFLDCGGVERTETNVIFQLWVNNLDVLHRLSPKKLLGIIKASQRLWGDQDPEVEFEYQGSTIYRYGIDLSKDKLILTNKKTACLAEELCGIIPKMKLNLADLTSSSSCCTPGSGCC